LLLLAVGGCRSAAAQPPLQGVQPADTTTSTTTFHVEGMACERCSGRLHGLLMKVDGVVAVDADHRTKSVVVQFDASRVSRDQIRAEIERAGFEVRS